MTEIQTLSDALVSRLLEKGTADAERIARALLDRLREEHRFVPEAIDGPTATLMKRLEGMTEGKEEK